MTPGANGSLGTSDCRSLRVGDSRDGSVQITGPSGRPSALPTGSVSVRPKRALSGGVALNVEYEITQPVCDAERHGRTCAKSLVVALAPGMIADTSRRRTA